jgi:hypothetical protein
MDGMTMVQFAWAALGLLGVALFAMIGMFFYLGARIDHLGDRMDGLSARMDARFDALTAARLDAHLEHHPGLTPGRSLAIRRRKTPRKSRKLIFVIGPR